MPAAPWTSGSTITAAISSSWAARIRSRSAASPGSAAWAVEEQRPVGGVEEVDAADRDRADRVAVVGVAQVDEGGAAGVLAAALLLVLEGHLQRDLDRGRARVRVEDAARGPAGAISTRRAASSAAPGWERPSIVEWATLPSWSRDRRVDAGVAMAVDVAPERGDAVEVAAPVGRRSGASPRRARSSAALPRTSPAAG